MTETQLEIVSGHVASIDNNRQPTDHGEQQEGAAGHSRTSSNFVPGRRVVVPTHDTNNTINSRYSQEDSVFETLQPERGTPEKIVQAMLPQPMPEIFINDEDNMESHKGSMVSLAKSADISMHRLRSNYNSRTNHKEATIRENAMENSARGGDRRNSDEHMVNMSKDAAHNLKDIGFDHPE